MSDPVSSLQFHMVYNMFSCLKPDNFNFLCSFLIMNVSCRDLDQASMEAVVSLLAGLPLQPEEGDGVELMEAKSQLFLKYDNSSNSFVLSFKVCFQFVISSLHLLDTLRCS